MALFILNLYDEGESSASCPDTLLQKKTFPGTHRIRGWIGSEAGLDAFKKIYI